MLHETIDSLSNQLTDIAAARTDLSLQKRAVELHQKELSTEIRCNKRLPQDRYRALLVEQTNNVRELLVIEKQASELKTQHHKIDTLIRQFRGVEKSPPVDGMHARLVLLRNSYVAFAADSSRVASMRRMAAEFSQAIDNILSLE